MDYDKTRMPASYDAGRGYSPQTLALWLDVIARATPHNASRILDLGCGTGRFARPIAERLNAEVIAIDPSEAMLAEARKKTSPLVTYRRAHGEDLPLADGAVDMVFMSMVFHHFNDRDRVVAECRRVLREDGRVVLRAGTAELSGLYPYYPFFPGIGPILARMLQSKTEIEEVFARGGFRLERHEIVQSPAASGWTEYAGRIAHRADTVLIQLDDMAFAAGLAALNAYAQTMPQDEPVVEPVDFFVFTKRRE
jgi:ubiquinone/menaquinone biosynthesis C-methylase UbiE